MAADSRSEAKAHYQTGVKLYNGGDYKGAIKEFSAAQELAPADLNNYNLALCYDKLGDPEPAIQYYRAFLDKQPNSDKKAEIEGSISRLEKAAKSAAAKKAARDQEEEAKRIADQKKADEEAKKADEAKRLEDAKKKPPVDEPPGGEVSGGIGSTGTPGGTGTVSTGDAQLDRVQRIDINAIRDQRVGGQSSGMVAPGPTGPSTSGPSQANDASNAAANIDVNAHAGAGAQPGPATASANQAQSNPNGAAMPEQPNDKPKATPVYKKWWFWAVVAVSAYVIYSIATEDDAESGSTARVMTMPPMGANSNSARGGTGGATLLSW